jgi:hypothetical protein
MKKITFVIRKMKNCNTNGVDTLTYTKSNMAFPDFEYSDEYVYGQFKHNQMIAGENWDKLNDEELGVLLDTYDPLIQR